MRRNAQLKIALDLSMGRERFNCQENCKVSGRGSYAQGSATCGIRMPVKSCCSHKNHCPVDGLLRSFSGRGLSAPLQATYKVRYPSTNCVRL